MEDYNEYHYYSGETDPRLSEPENPEELEIYEHVECPEGCGFWAGQLIEGDQCPECGSECHELADDFFDI